jgi:hypothetical protein
MVSLEFAGIWNVRNFVDLHSFMMLEYEKVLNEC